MENERKQLENDRRYFNQERDRMEGDKDRIVRMNSQLSEEKENLDHIVNNLNVEAKDKIQVIEEMTYEFDKLKSKKDRYKCSNKFRI